MKGQAGSEVKLQTVIRLGYSLPTLPAEGNGRGRGRRKKGGRPVPRLTHFGISGVEIRDR
jgi:hypothetical protein